MDPLLKKLNFKGQSPIHVLNAPPTVAGQISAFAAHAPVNTDAAQVRDAEFVLVFVLMQTELDAMAQLVGPQLKGDAVFWICYPKGSSKRYTCDFNRDTGWSVLGQFGLEGVRQVAIDEDWSALRFRKAQYIKTMTRSFGALSEEGKARIGQ
jgi:hypothetical protein